MIPSTFFFGSNFVWNFKLATMFPLAASDVVHFDETYSNQLLLNYVRLTCCPNQPLLAIDIWKVDTGGTGKWAGEWLLLQQL